MSQYTFAQNATGSHIEIKNPQGILLYSWPLAGVDRSTRQFTLDKLYGLLGDCATYRLAVKGTVVTREIPDKKFGLKAPKEYHRIQQDQPGFLQTCLGYLRRIF